MLFLSSGKSGLKRSPFAFTLIELLIVVAIIAVLAAIAVPNFLEAQSRAKVSRARADLRTLSMGIESYRVDTNKYPQPTSTPDNYSPTLGAMLGTRAAGFFTFQTRVGATKVAGRDFFTLTTPISYLTSYPEDPFSADAGAPLPYSYNALGTLGYIITSFGPDHDLMSDIGGKVGAGIASNNPFSTAQDPKTPAGLGDISEHGFADYLRGSASWVAKVNAWGGKMGPILDDLSYDPTNGTISDGDLYRVGP